MSTRLTLTVTEVYLLASPTACLMILGLVINGLFLYLHQKGSRRRCVACNFFSFLSSWLTSSTSRSNTSSQARGNTFTSSLNVVGIVTCCTALPATLIFLIFSSAFEPSIAGFCVTAATFSMCINATNLTLFLINVERFYAISDPFKEAWITRRSDLCVSLIWLASILTFSFPLIENAYAMEQSQNVTSIGSTISHTVDMYPLSNQLDTQEDSYSENASNHNALLLSLHGILESLENFRTNTSHIKIHNNLLALWAPENFGLINVADFSLEGGVNVLSTMGDIVEPSLLNCASSNSSISQLYLTGFTNIQLSCLNSSNIEQENEKRSVEEVSMWSESASEKEETFSNSCLETVSFINKTCASNVLGIFISNVNLLIPQVLDNLMKSCHSQHLYSVFWKNMSEKDIGLFLFNEDFQNDSCHLEKSFNSTPMHEKVRIKYCGLYDNSVYGNRSTWLETCFSENQEVITSKSHNFSYYFLIPQLATFFIGLVSQVVFVRAISRLARKKIAARDALIRAAVAVTHCTAQMAHDQIRPTDVETVEHKQNIVQGRKRKLSFPLGSNSVCPTPNVFAGTVTTVRTSGSCYPTQSRKMVKVSVLTVLAYVVTSGPYVLFALAILVTDGTLPLFGHILTQMIAYLAPCVNPFIYSFLRKQVRIDFMRTIQRAPQLRRMTSLSLRATAQRSSLKVPPEKHQLTPSTGRKSMPNIIYE